jgi:hypothetical protein
VEAFERAIVVVESAAGPAVTTSLMLAGHTPQASPSTSPVGSPAQAGRADGGGAGGGGGFPVGADAAGTPGAARSSREAVARACACLADALAAQMKLGAALTAARRAYELRRSMCPPGAHSTPLLQSMQQVAALSDALDKPQDATRYLEPLVAALKGVKGDEAAMLAVQRGLRHIVRLTFRSMPTSHRALLQRAVAAAAGAATPAALSFVVSRLLATSHPSNYVRGVSTRVLAAISSGSIVLDGAAAAMPVHPGAGDLGAPSAGGPASPDEPAALAQLAAVVSLLSAPTAPSPSGGAGDASGSAAAVAAADAQLAWLTTVGSLAAVGAGGNVLYDTLDRPVVALAAAVTI